MPTYVYSCPVHGRTEVDKHMRDAGRDECCRACMEAAFDRRRSPEEQAPFVARIPWKMRRIYTPQRTIIRPSGHRLQPGERTSTPGLAFDDFRYEMERGELREDATPVTLSPTELAAFDNPPITIPPDPARDRALHQLVAQHWTEDLSPGVAYNRELAAKAAREHAEAVS